MARTPRKPITEQDLNNYVGLIAMGVTAREAARLLDFPMMTLKDRIDRKAANDPAFRTLLDRAKIQRRIKLTEVMASSMLDQLRKGHPWWAKLAMHTYDLPFKDPDERAWKLKEIQRQVDAIFAKVLPLIPESRQAEAEEAFRKSAEVNAT